MSRILMINVPFSGHVNPTLPLASELVKRGNQISREFADSVCQTVFATGMVRRIHEERFENVRLICAID